MKIAFTNLIGLEAVGLLVGLLGLAGCASHGGETAGQRSSDREITKSVEKQLKDDPTFKYPNVKVNVYQGNIQLAGVVSNPEQRQRAAELASRVQGAHQVINGIMLTPLPTGSVPIRDMSHPAAQPSAGAPAPPPPANPPPPEPNPQR